MTISSEQLALLNENDLINFATSQLGLAIRPGWTREKIITYIMKTASAAENYEAA